MYDINQLANEFEADYNKFGKLWGDYELEPRIAAFLTQNGVPVTELAVAAAFVYNQLGESNDWGDFA